jgi:putative transposon-encoded protein
LKGAILALIHLRVLLLNKYEISSIFEYQVQNSGNCKKGECPEDNIGIKIGLKKFMSINFHQKMSNWRIDI